jgi:hypothetical protein
MSTVADGPEMSVSGRVGSSVLMASGTDGTIWSVRTTQVVVGEQRERAPAHPRAAVENDRPGLGDRDGARRDHAVRCVEGVVVEWGCVFYLIYGGQPALRNPIGRDDVAGLSLCERGLDGGL